MAKHIKYLIIHCTATPAGRVVSKSDIVRWHTSPSPNGRGWDRVGYSDLIALNGSLVNLTIFNQDNLIELHEMTWGAKGINSMSRHVVYVGGVDDKGKPKDTRTCEQKAALKTYVEYMILRHPNIKVAGHNQFSQKACPSFDVQAWLKTINIPLKNQYDV